LASGRSRHARNNNQHRSRSSRSYRRFRRPLHPVPCRQGARGTGRVHEIKHDGTAHCAPRGHYGAPYSRAAAMTGPNIICDRERRRQTEGAVLGSGPGAGGGAPLGRAPLGWWRGHRRLGLVAARSGPRLRAAGGLARGGSEREGTAGVCSSFYEGPVVADDPVARAPPGPRGRLEHFPLNLNRRGFPSHRE
jgi:hypothetical protein